MSEEDKQVGWLIGKFAVGLLIFIFVIFNIPFVTVGAGNRGVVMNWGKVSDTILDEGIHFKIPFVQSVKKMSVRVQKNDVPAEAASKDLQTVRADIAVNWHIQPNKVNKVYQQIGDNEVIVEGIIRPAVNEVVKAATAQKNAEEIIKLRPQLKSDIDKQLSERLSGYNLIVDDVSIVNVDFSQDFNAAIEAKQVAEQQTKQAQFVADKAKKDAEAAINKARGEAEAQRLQQQTLTPELIQKLALERWNGQLPQYWGGGALPFIDIQK